MAATRCNGPSCERERAARPASDFICIPTVWSVGHWTLHAIGPRGFPKVVPPCWVRKLARTGHQASFFAHAKLRGSRRDQPLRW